MSQPSSHELLNALRQLSLLVRLGYPVAEGLKSMSDEASPWLTRLAEDMERGDTLGEAMARQPRLFSPYFRSLLEAAAGQPSPNKILDELSHWLNRSQEGERKVGSLLLYPVLLLAVVCLFLTLYFLMIFPQAVAPLLQIVHQAPVDSADSLAWLAVIPVLFFVYLAWSVGLGRPWQPLLWLFPEIRGVRSLASQSLWARAMGSLLAAGVPVPEALEQALPVVSCSELKSELTSAVQEVRRGTPLGDALGRCSKLESYLVWGLQGEQPAALILEGADALERELEMRVQTQMRLMLPRALLVVGVLSTLALVSFWLPFYGSVVNLR